MNHKQKLGYMALGAGILAVGIAIGQFITPNIEARSNGVFDEITCRSLSVVDEKGKKRIFLQAQRSVGSAIVYDKAGKPVIVLGTGENGNAILIRDKAGNQAAGLGAYEKGNAMIVRDKEGKVAAGVGAYEKWQCGIRLR